MIQPQKEKFSQLSMSDLPQNQLNEDDIQLETVNLSVEHISPETDRFPYCIVWTALPLITWLIPIIGHTGIALSNGVIHDFAGPYTISVDHFSFGKPLKYVKIKENNLSKDKYDSSILKADNKFCQLMHNLFCNNCHSHVADALNHMAYKGKQDWTMVSVWWLCISSSSYVSWTALLWTYLPFLIICTIVGFITVISQ